MSPHQGTGLIQQIHGLETSIDKLEAYINTHHKSKSAFAGAINVPPATIAEIISGKRRVSPNVAVKIQEATGIDAVSLVLSKELGSTLNRVNDLLLSKE